MAFVQDTILTKEEFLLSLCAIESIKQGSIESEDSVADKLRGDVILIARTVGGFEYVISMLHIQTVMGATFLGEKPEEMARNIISRWKHIKSIKG